MRRLACFALATLMLTSCARNMDNSTYTSDNTVGKVLRGTVLSTRVVTVKDHDSLGDNTTGGLAGGAAGAVAGSNIGKGNGSTAGAVGGAIAGAIIGAIIEDQLTTQQGIEYIVQLDAAPSKANKRRRNISVRSDKAIDADIKDSINMAETETDVISVIQTGDVIPAGQRVLIVYNDDRPRLVPAR